MTLASSDNRPLALVFRTGLLPISETFIRTQVLALKRWQARLVGLRHIDGLKLDPLGSHLVDTWEKPFAPRALRAALREFNLPPPGALGRLRRLNPAIAHVHFGTDLVKLWPMLNGLQMPILTTLHGYDINIHPEVWERGRRNDRKYPQRLREIARDARVRFVAVSEAIKKRAIEFGLPAERIFVRYIGVDTELFAPSGLPVAKRRRRILFVGRMVEKKCPHILIKAFARVRERVADAELVMIGGGPLLESSKALAASLNVPIEFLSAAPHTRVKHEMEQARVFCLPSITAANGDAEGLGIVILEAQAAGVPVVTSARGGLGEAIEHGVTGFAFAESDVDALCESLTRLLLDDELASNMSVAARARACTMFDLHKCTAMLESLYDQSVGEISS